MSTHKEALQELLAKVEAGDDTNDGSMFRAFGDNWTACYDAYHGSLDAAKALHEAVLPEWSGEARISGFGGGQASVWHPMKAPHHGGTIRVDNPDPARAWLIAIIKALIAQEPEA